MRGGPASGGDGAWLGFVFLGGLHLGSGVLGAATVTPDTWRCCRSVRLRSLKPQVPAFISLAFSQRQA